MIERVKFCVLIAVLPSHALCTLDAMRRVVEKYLRCLTLVFIQLQANFEQHSQIIGIKYHGSISLSTLGIIAISRPTFFFLPDECTNTEWST